PHRRLDAGRCLGWVTMAPGTIVARRAAFGTRTLPHLGEFFRCSITVIRFALLDQFLGDLAMALGTGELRHGLAVPGEAEPGKAVQNGRRGRFRRALAVGILDAQQHLAAGMLGIEPVEQRSARAAYMQVTGRGGGKTGDHCLRHESLAAERWRRRPGWIWVASHVA